MRIHHQSTILHQILSSFSSSKSNDGDEWRGESEMLPTCPSWPRAELLLLSSFRCSLSFFVSAKHSGLFLSATQNLVVLFKLLQLYLNYFEKHIQKTEVKFYQPSRVGNTYCKRCSPHDVAPLLSLQCLVEENRAGVIHRRDM